MRRTEWPRLIAVGRGVRPDPGWHAEVAARLICFPYAGGGLTSFRSWAPRLPDNIELLVVEPQPRSLSQPLLTSLRSLVDACCRILIKELDRPFVLFGHSFGALAAFEVARHLEYRHSLVPSCLFVSAHRAPHVPRRGAALYALDDNALMGKLSTLHGTAPAVLADSGLMAVLLPVIRADLEMDETYSFVPGRPLSCPISVLGGSGDPVVDLDELKQWPAHTTEACSIRLWKGEHFFLHAFESEVVAHVVAVTLRLMMGGAGAPPDGEKL